MSEPVRIGMIGTDNSRVVAFARLLHNPGEPWFVPGGKITAAYPGEISPDFAMSYERRDGYARQLQEEWGVAIVPSPEQVAAQCDALMLEAVDGRSRLRLFRQIAPWGKPVFIDKPLALDAAEAEQILEEAQRHGIAVMSSSALRYSESLSLALDAGREKKAGAVTGADFYGPLPLEPTQPGLFWYGIHLVEMLYRTMGTGCRYVEARKTEGHELISGVWKDGRIGMIRGNRTGNPEYGGVIHHERGSLPVAVRSSGKSFFATQLEKVLLLFTAGVSDVDPAEMLEVIRFIEAANESRLSGKRVML